MEWLYHESQSGRRRLKRRVRWALWAAGIGFGAGLLIGRLFG